MDTIDGGDKDKVACCAARMTHGKSTHLFAKNTRSLLRMQCAFLAVYYKHISRAQETFLFLLQGLPIATHIEFGVVATVKAETIRRRSIPKET